MTHRSAVLVLIAVLAIPTAYGQEDQAKYKAVSQMRKIAKAVKECPERPSPSKCFVFHYGPPANLEWDVLPSKTVRSPFQGIMEFTMPIRKEPIDPEKQTKADRQYCENLERMAANYPVPPTGYYRYEFDLDALGNSELVKRLWVLDETKKTFSTYDDNECWVKAARSFDSK